MLEKLLPRHLQLIYLINHYFIQSIKHVLPNNPSII